MVVIKRRTRHLMVILPAMALMLLGYQNCAVDHMSMNTPGAASVDCNPTAQELADFELVFNPILNNATGTFPSGTQKCAACHGDQLAPNGAGGFVVFMGNTTNNLALVKRNLCSIADLGQNLADRPLNLGHGGGQYPASDIQILIDWVRTNL